MKINILKIFCSKKLNKSWLCEAFCVCWTSVCVKMASMHCLKVSVCGSNLLTLNHRVNSPSQKKWKP